MILEAKFGDNPVLGIMMMTVQLLVEGEILYISVDIWSDIQVKGRVISKSIQRHSKRWAADFR